MLIEIFLVIVVLVLYHVCHDETVCAVQAHLDDQRFSYSICMAADIETLYLQKTEGQIEMME